MAPTMGSNTLGMDRQGAACCSQNLVARPQHCASTIQLSRDREGQDLAACYEVLQEEQSKGHRLAQDL